MLVNCDVKGLEVVVAAELSKDKTLMQEVRDKTDFHALNQAKFNLPSRVIAKIFKFKLLYGATAFGYSKDSDFIHVSTSADYWQGIIDEYYNKYKGIRQWHNELINTAKRNGRLEIPSGRFYPITPDFSKRGEPWPLTIIKNYPVQGFGADLVMLARLEARRLFRKSGVEALLISTIHDSIVADCEEWEVMEVGRMLNQAVEAVPQLCHRVFGYEFALPMTAEVQVGRNKKEMKELNLA